MKMEFKGNLVKRFIERFNLTKNQAKKLICVTSLCDGFGAIYPTRSEWIIRTNPNMELHSFVYDLFLYGYGVKFPGFYKICKNGRQRSTELNGKKYEKILKDLFTFTPTFKTSKAKSTNERLDKYLSDPQPTLNFLFNEPIWFQELAFRLALDLEGCISPNISVKKKEMSKYVYYQFQFEPMIKLSVVHPILIFEWQMVSNSINIPLTVKRDRRTWSGFDGLRTSDRFNILRLNKIGGFLTNVRIYKSSGPKNNNGYSKNCILRTCCEILDSHRNVCSKSFSEIKSAQKYKEDFINNYYFSIREKIKRWAG